jgi:hypothetical protein
MTNAINQMWLVIGTFLALNAYGLTYSSVLFARYYRGISECTVVDSFGTFLLYTFSRLVCYTLWTYPVIWALWPRERTWYGALKDYP